MLKICPLHIPRVIPPDPSHSVTVLQMSDVRPFYRATLRVSAVFAVSRCPSVSPSVRPSRWCIVSRRLKIPSNFFLGTVAPSFQFLTQSAGAQFQGKPLQGNTRGWKNCDFRPKSPFIWETVRDSTTDIFRQ